MKKKVVVGMSGGVDSSVAAAILKEQGYDVIGVTMQIWQDELRCDIEDKGGCCGLSAVDDARMVAQKLDIPYYVLNFKKDFKEKVIDYFMDEYTKGRTPNPCIACNQYVKWESLLEKALQLGAEYIATGHYAKIVQKNDGRYTIAKSVTDEKDQTYALYSLTQFQLAHTLMPVGDYTKDEIRAMAAKIDLKVANKKDSQEICFIPDNDYGKFISENLGQAIPKGDFVDTQGRILGQHRGIVHYTIGQRKGLGIAFGQPMYVSEIHPATNTVVLSNNEQLFSNHLSVTNVNFMGIEALGSPMRVMGKIRYSHKMAPCIIQMKDGRLDCVFDTPQRAITPGQAAVFYIDDQIVCGGTID